MTQRSAPTVVLKVETITLDGEARTVLYGPFLPHVGGVASGFEDHPPCGEER